MQQQALNDIYYMRICPSIRPTTYKTDSCHVVVMWPINLSVYGQLFHVD